MKKSINNMAACLLSAGVIFCLAGSPAAYAAQDTSAVPLPLIAGNVLPDSPAEDDKHSSKPISAFSGTFTLENIDGGFSAQNIVATTADQNTVLLRKGAKLTMSASTLSKAGDTTSEEGSNFNGQNAIFLAAEDSQAALDDLTMTSSADGANAVFATGSKTTVTIKNSRIHTTGNSSRGLDATYGGTIIADNIEIATEGAHCAPLATDRGEGIVTVTDAILSAAGEGSPCVYSTGNITVNDSIGTAAGSECAVIEGKNSITLHKTDLTGHKQHGIMLYQSFSGDASEGTAHFTAYDSTLTTTSGPMFFVTNTTAEVDLVNTELNFISGTLINAAASRWGHAGTNGGHLTFNGSSEQLVGDITADNISSVILSLTNNTVLTGAINSGNTAQSMSLALDASSIWNVTADSHLTVLNDSDITLKNIRTNGHTVYYDSSNAANRALAGRTIVTGDGGRITPVQ